MDIEPVDPILTAKIVGGYVRQHKVSPEQLPEIITSVHQALGRVGQPVESEEILTPAVSVRQSVRQEYVVCLDCGYRAKMLRRHINSQHGFSPDEYLKRWGLRADHPLTAPAYSERRSILAKELGLGQKTRAVSAVSPTPPVSANTDPKIDAKATRRRSNRSASKSNVVSEAAAAPMPARRRSRSRAASPQSKQTPLPTAET